jgi:glyoxylase-like metal-dependent hydrolase (beta-lactamase superfamily II)
MAATPIFQSPTSTVDASELFHRFSIGDLQFTSLSDGFIDTPATFVASGVDEGELLGFLASVGQDTERLRTPVGCLHVHSPKHGQILVDSGMGHVPGPHGGPIPTVGKLPQALKAAGISPSDINIVLASHIHPDHIGGLFDDDDQPFFPNAVHYVSTLEADFWGKHADLSGALMPPVMQQQTIATAQRYLRLAAKGRLNTFAAGADVLDDIGTILLDGHTPGQVGFLFETKARKLFFSADAIGHPWVSVMRPHWRFAFDTNSPLAIATRERLIARLIDEGWYTFTPHFTWPSVGRMTMRNEVPCWVPGLN